MDNLNVNPAQMYMDAGGFYEIYTVAKQITSYLQNEMGGLGNFWGNGDSFGDTFLATWRPGVDGLGDTTTQIGTGMQDTQDKVLDSADLYTKSDEVNTDMLP
jgi:hypothetical protein